MVTTIIVTTNQPIGACESMTIKESRTEDGYSSAKLEVPRMRFSRERIKEAFERGFFHVAAQKIPLHISVIEDKVEIIRAHNVWITEIAVSFTTDEWIIAEGIKLECEYITGTIKSSNDSAST